jgi:hypothetical protein
MKKAKEVEIYNKGVSNGKVKNVSILYFSVQTSLDLRK